MSEQEKSQHEKLTNSSYVNPSSQIVINPQNSKRSMSWWLSKTVTMLGIFYLLAVMVLPENSKFKVNRIDNTEIIVLAIVLFFNSGILEKLEDFTIDGTKIAAKFKNLENIQDKQQEEIDSFQQKQLEILDKQQKEIAHLQKQHDLGLKLALRGLLDQFEAKHLRGLKKCEDENIPYWVSSEWIDYLEKEMRHLYAVRFLKRKSSIRDFFEELRLVDKKDLAEAFSVTPEGKEYLDLLDTLKVDITYDENW
ncbi:MAG: hypothetical protein ACHWZW_13730 [Spirulina sp.]